MHEPDIIIPDDLALPSRPGYWLWGFFSILASAALLFVLIVFFPVFWAGKTLMMSGAFFAFFFAILSLPIYLFERKKNYVNEWNEKQQRYVEHLLSIKQKSLPVAFVKIFTAKGEHGNAALSFAWQGARTSPVVSKDNESVEGGASLGMIDTRLSQNEKKMQIIDRLLQSVPATSLSQLKNGNLMIVDVFSEEEHAFFKEKWPVISKKYGMSVLHPSFMHSHEMNGLLNEKMAAENNGDSSLLIIAMNPPVSKAHNAEIAVALLLDKKSQQSGVLHRPVIYSEAESIITAIQYGDINATEIEAIWHSGVNDLVCSRLQQTICQHAKAETIKLINIDEIYGYTQAAAEWFVCALATEWAKSSGRPQIVISHHNQTMIRIVSPH